MRRRMRREARIAAALHHPHLVEFLEEVVDGHERWLVMEYVPSQSLAQCWTAAPAPPERDTHRRADRQRAGGGARHRHHAPGRQAGQRTGHRDGTAKLTDLGISRPIYGDVMVTDSGLIGGTVAFFASEVADGEEPTPASDVVALGATLFAAVEGIPPFGTADNPLLVLRRAAAVDILPFRHAGPLAPVLSALLQPDPAKRPDAARAWQMLQELAATLTDDEGSGPLQSPVVGVDRYRRRRPAPSSRWPSRVGIAIKPRQGRTILFGRNRRVPPDLAILDDSPAAPPAS